MPAVGRDASRNALSDHPTSSSRGVRRHANRARLGRLPTHSNQKRTENTLAADSRTRPVYRFTHSTLARCRTPRRCGIHHGLPDEHPEPIQPSGRRCWREHAARRRTAASGSAIAAVAQVGVIGKILNGRQTVVSRRLTEEIGREVERGVACGWSDYSCVQNRSLPSSLRKPPGNAGGNCAM